jgi:hypothetical protein
MYCNHCGKEVTETSTYCNFCGSKIGLLDDPVISGMKPFGVSENQSVKNESGTDIGEIVEDIFKLLGVIILNGIFFTVTYFTTPSLVKSYIGVYYLNNDSNHEYDGWYFLIYIIPILLWQWSNDKIFDWSDDFKNSSLDNVSIFSYLSIFIPIVPTIISFYFLTQNEYLPITIQNMGIYVLSFISCWIYYWIKPSD